MKIAASELIAIEARLGAHNYKPLDVVLARGEGVWVWDIDGKRYLDCLSAYSAVNQGHCHPKIIQALIEQAGKVTLTSRAFRNDQLGPFLKELCELTGFEMALPMNSGAEAVETALKLARKWAYEVKCVPKYQAEIVAVAGNFHGRTISVVSFSSEPSYREPFGPFTPGFITIPYGDVSAFEKAITPNTAAIIVEPIQGEAGVIIPQAGYMTRLREICDRNNILLMADEIQTGLGRTGKMFACDHDGIRPDVMIIGKALSGGVYPVSAALSSRKIMGLFRPGEHGSTFGGNPLAAAVGRAALKVLVEEKLVENSAVLGEYFLERIVEIPSPHVKEVRGKGLFIGVELKPTAGGARRFCEALKERGILCKETHDHVIRFAPPLIIERQTIDGAIPAITEVLNMK